MTLSALVAALDAWCPFGTAYDWDNVGLQVGDPGATLTGGVIALDLTHAVLDEVLAQGGSVVVTHHPLIFKPLKRVAAGPGPSGLAFRCAAEGVAHVALHTNLDVARGGVSFALAGQLGLENVRALQPLEGATVKLVTFVPEAHEPAVRAALGDAGAGRIGLYRDCAFSMRGTGYFRPEPGTQPFTGTPEGTLEQAHEVRLETEVPRACLAPVLAALRAAHPYEEVAYDVVPLEQPSTVYGLGAVGDLPEAEAGEAFLRRVAEALGEDALRYAGDKDRPVRRVAVCGGSGSDLVGLALRAGADAFVTADVTYHRFFDALDAAGRPALLYVDARHDATERIAETLLLDACRTLAPGVPWQRTTTRTSPAQTWRR
jgi:dinuclear metal center YbgI/SA1388 family protein